MKIIGTEQEIEWVKNALRNHCGRCPYMEPCNREASEDQKKWGEVRHTCFEYLDKSVEFVVLKNNI